MSELGLTSRISRGADEMRRTAAARKVKAKVEGRQVEAKVKAEARIDLATGDGRRRTVDRRPTKDEATKDVMKDVP